MLILLFFLLGKAVFVAEAAQGLGAAARLPAEAEELELAIADGVEFLERVAPPRRRTAS